MNKVFDSPMLISDSAAKRMRVAFNPSKLTDVDKVKRATAALITAMEEVFAGTEDVETRRCAATAMTQLEIGGMMAVKAMTANV